MGDNNNNENRLDVYVRLLRITYQNTENYYLIGRFEDLHTGKDFTSVGNLANPQTGLSYRLSGYWTIHEKYGRQFKFDAHTTLLPKDPCGVLKYLVHTCKFVGSAISNKIVDEYQEDTIEILKTDPERVAADIKGITIERAFEIQESLIKNEETEQVRIELGALLNIEGLRKSLPDKLIEKYGSNAPEIVKENPYVLTQEHGVSFIMADRVAIDLGIDPVDIKRKKAALIHVIMEEMQQNGHTTIEHSPLKFKVNNLIGTVRIEQAISELQQQDHQIIRYQDKWMMADYHKKEIAIANKIKELIF